MTLILRNGIEEVSKGESVTHRGVDVSYRKGGDSAHSTSTIIMNLARLSGKC